MAAMDNAAIHAFQTKATPVDNAVAPSIVTDHAAPLHPVISDKGVVHAVDPSDAMALAVSQLQAITARFVAMAALLDATANAQMHVSRLKDRDAALVVEQ